jgi:hypothetical protein
MAAAGHLSHDLRLEARAAAKRVMPKALAHTAGLIITDGSTGTPKRRFDPNSTSDAKVTSYCADQ